ncbi:MAG: cystathionine beta-lyase/cystathionine gamma-synthase [Planctomycetota bacterium]|jgi:cystathionine beta-lyase/cystathionine gamma-synthase
MTTKQAIRARFETLCPRAGQGQNDGEPLVTPIVQSTTFCREGVGSTAEHQYSRVSNPTVAALESALGQLESAEPALAFGTGLGAETCLFLTLLSAGEHVVCSSGLYGGTTRLLEQVLSRLGIETTFVDSRDVEAVRAAVQANTRLIFVETPANPTLHVTDVRAIAAIARAAGALLAVDNTFLTPLLQQPLDLGAAVSVLSTTKFIEGHSAALGGALVTRDPVLRERLEFVRKCTGGIQAPFQAWLTLQGLKTLPLRLERQSASAETLARWLLDQPEVARVNYPGLGGEAERKLCEEQHIGAHGAVLSFELRGGYERARQFVEALKTCRLVEHVGSVETLITHSASMTHAGISSEQRAAIGVSDALLRLSVGLEAVSALRDDLSQALTRTKLAAAIAAEVVA